MIRAQFGVIIGRQSSHLFRAINNGPESKLLRFRVFVQRTYSKDPSGYMSELPREHVNYFAAQATDVIIHQWKDEGNMRLRDFLHALFLIEIGKSCGKIKQTQ